MKNIYGLLVVILLAWVSPLQGAVINPADSWENLSGVSVQKVGSKCDMAVMTICTVEIWLGHKQKKKDRAIRKFLKSNSLKVLRHTIQYWKPLGGHPPTNIAIGRGLSAKDARFIMTFALQYNDRIDGLVHQRLNPPNYVAIATSAWDAQSETPVTPENLKRLMDPKLTTKEFQKLYVQLTGESDVPVGFY